MREQTIIEWVIEYVANQQLLNFFGASSIRHIKSVNIIEVYDIAVLLKQRRTS